jgi:tight adherence protein C
VGAELALVAVVTGFAAALLGVYAVSDYFLSRRRVMQQLRTMESFEIAPTDVRARELAAPARTRLLFPGMRRIGAAARRLTPAGVIDRLRQQIVHAGSPAGWDAERVLVAKLLLAVGLGFLAVTFGTAVAFPVIGTFGVAALSVFVGWFVPEWVVRAKAGKRQNEIARTLPDALDLLSITVEAGLGFDAALQRVSREMGGALGQEFYRVVQEMQLGKSRQDALRGLSGRSNVPSLKEFVLAMIQADVFGMSITNVLHVQAEELRLKRRQTVEEQAQKVPVKMIFPLVMCILPATFIVLAGPGVLRIVDVFSEGLL